MGQLVYSALTSLDGFVADREGRFDWAMPDDEVHAFVNEMQRAFGTHLYGRRLYEVMCAWEDMPVDEEPEVIRDFARSWRDADKVVYSSTLPDVTTDRTRLARTFDPASVSALKEGVDHALLVGGPTLAAEALRAGLVDELHQLLSPVVVGGGTPYLPDGVHLDLELLDQRRFDNGVVHLHYRVRN